MSNTEPESISPGEPEAVSPGKSRKVNAAMTYAQLSTRLANHIGRTDIPDDVVVDLVYASRLLGFLSNKLAEDAREMK